MLYAQYQITNWREKWIAIQIGLKSGDGVLVLVFIQTICPFSYCVIPYKHSTFLCVQSIFNHTFYAYIQTSRVKNTYRYNCEAMFFLRWRIRFKFFGCCCFSCTVGYITFMHAFEGIFPVVDSIWITWSNEQIRYCL